MPEPLLSKQAGLLRSVHTTILPDIGVASPDELQNKLNQGPNHVGNLYGSEDHPKNFLLVHRFYFFYFSLFIL